MFNGMLYRFDENSRVIYTDWYIISQFGVVVTMLIDGVIILKNHKVMGMRDTLSWLSYIVLSGIMIALEEKYECVPLYLTITICTLIIYTMISLDQDRRIAEHKLEISESNVRIMLSQIQPHFLYNSLTAIAQLCENDPHKAKEATISFSRYLRMNMDSLNEHDVIPFEKELEHVKTYCSIELKWSTCQDTKSKILNGMTYLKLNDRINTRVWEKLQRSVAEWRFFPYARPTLKGVSLATYPRSQDVNVLALCRIQTKNTFSNSAY